MPQGGAGSSTAAAGPAVGSDPPILPRETAHRAAAAAEGESFKSLSCRASARSRDREREDSISRRRRKHAAASARRCGRERGRQGRPGIVGVAIASCALLVTLLKQAEAAHFNQTWCAVPLLGPNDDPQTACEAACATSNPADASNKFTGTHWYTTNCIYHQSEHVIHRVYMEHMPRVMEASPISAGVLRASFPPAVFPLLARCDRSTCSS